MFGQVKKACFAAIILSFLMAQSFAQSADFVMRILQKKEVTFGDVCYILAVWQGLISDSDSEVAALNAIFEIGALPRCADTHTKITYKETSAVLCRLWDIKGGPFYRISNGAARYAFRQLERDEIIPAGTNPTAIPSGKEALNIFMLANLKYKSGTKKR